MLLRAFTLAAVLMISACAQVTRAPSQSPPSEEIRGADTVVNVTGLGDVKFGLNRSELTSHLNTDRPGCNTQMRAYPQGSLVFTPEDELVLMWFNAPLKTGEGISTGSALEAVKTAYPQATELQAPPGSNRYDGLLVASGEHGYLFLHDGKKVQKAIAGFVEFERRLFESGFGAC